MKDDIDVKWIYKNDTDNTSRFVLGTLGDNSLVCIGVNPSTAEPCKLDNTLRSVERICKANGYDSWIMLNLYPQRATNPNDLHVYKEIQLSNENLIHIKTIMQERHPRVTSGTLGLPDPEKEM